MIPSTKAKQREYLDELIHIAEGLLAALKVLRSELHNRPPMPKRPAQKRRVAPATLRRDHSNGHSMQAISQHYGISIGRVSEAVHGKRT